MTFFAAVRKQLFAIGICAFAISSSTESLHGALITNPPIPILYQVTVNTVIASNSNGSNTAEFFGNATQQATIEGLVNDIWAQAGIVVNFQTPEFWDDDFVNIGTIGNNDPRPTGDLNTIVANAGPAGFLDPDPLVINMFFVEIAAGFSDTSENTANGLAFVGGNGITQHVGDNLVSFLGGQEVIASVVAHEIGHNLGLPHIVEFENLMQTGGSPNQGERLNAAQVATAQGSQFSVLIPIPEPGSVLFMTGLSLVVLTRRKRAMKV